MGFDDISQVVGIVCCDTVSSGDYAFHKVTFAIGRSHIHDHAEAKSFIRFHSNKSENLHS